MPIKAASFQAHGEQCVGDPAFATECFEAIQITIYFDWAFALYPIGNLTHCNIHLSDAVVTREEAII